MPLRYGLTVAQSLAYLIVLPEMEPLHGNATHLRFRSPRIPAIEPMPRPYRYTGMAKAISLALSLALLVARRVRSVVLSLSVDSICWHLSS
jgi:hypothetical protein